jgi:hypothetical protein
LRPPTKTGYVLIVAWCVGGASPRRRGGQEDGFFDTYGRLRPISSIGFSIYLANFVNYGATYGSLGAAVGLLFYFYLTASVVLVGTEVNATVYHLTPDGATQTATPGSG